MLVEVVLSRLLEAGLQGSIAFAVVLLLVTFIKRLSPTAKCWLWRLCGLKFVVAFCFILAVPVLPRKDAVSSQSPIPSFPTKEVVSEATKTTTVQQPLSTVSPDWNLLIIVGWGVGALGLVSIRIAKEINGRKQVFKESTRLNLESPGRYFVSPHSQSPLVVGVFRPAISLPSHIIDQPDELEMAIAHERAHIARRDILWNALLSITSCLFWFLPPAHWISRLARIEAEAACDQAVLDLTGRSAGQYARFLVRLAQQPSATIGSLGMASQTRNQLSKRIQAMNNRSRLNKAALAAIAILSIPALFPWQAVAQGSSTSMPSNEKLDDLAMRYLHLPVEKGGVAYSSEQQARMRAQLKRAQQEVRDHGQKIADMKSKGISDKDRIAYDNSIRTSMYLRHWREAWDILSPAQQDRQRQLVLQYRGPLVLGSRSIASLIGISRAQAGEIATLDQEYATFISRQDQQHWIRFQGLVGPKEIQSRDFTKAEKARLNQLEEALFTASGQTRSKLQKEYYEIRGRVIRYEGDLSKPQSTDSKQMLAKMVRNVMDARRKKLEVLSQKALAVLTLQQQQKWKAVQGAPATFKFQESDGIGVFAYR